MKLQLRDKTKQQKQNSLIPISWFILNSTSNW